MKNPVDALVEYFSPVAGRERQKARLAIHATAELSEAFGITNRRRSALKSWNPKKSADVNADIGREIGHLRELARDLERNAPLAHAAFNVLNYSVIGAGLRARPQLDAKTLSLSKEAADQKRAEIALVFETWAESKEADYLGLSSFYDLQNELFHSHLLNGDAFCLVHMRESSRRAFYTQLQTVEADRVRGPLALAKKAEGQVVSGYELSKTGKPKAIYIADSQYARESKDFKRVPLRGRDGRPLVLAHRYHAKRSSQLRGISLLHPVIEALKKVDRYMQAELTASSVSAMLTVFIKRLNEQTEFSNEPDSSEAQGDFIEDMKLTEGGIMQVPDGYDVDVANPTRPNVAFEPFVLSMWRQLGAALGIPYEILIMNFNASYSASKASLLEFYKRVLVHRASFVRNVCQPVYEQVLFEAVARGFIDLPGFLDSPVTRAAWCKSHWHGPVQGDIDEVKSAKAAKLRLELGISSKEQEAQKTWGRSYEQIKQERALEDEEELDNET